MNAMPDAEETGSGRERSNGICLYPATCHQYHERDEQDDTHGISAIRSKI
jgi:hypothetical protein